MTMPANKLKNTAVKTGLLLLLSFFISSCGKNTSIAACNPEEGRFIDGTHYIAGDMLTEDEKWDYLSLQKYHIRRSELYPDPECIPIKPDPTFEETLNNKIEKKDFEGKNLY